MGSLEPEEFDAFSEYVQGHILANSLNSMSLEDSVNEFRKYQKELAEVRQKIRQAEESSAQGKSKTLDVKEVMERVRTRLRNNG